MNFKSKAAQSITLILTLISLAYWSITHFYNVYRTAIGGAISEILWLPLMLLLFGMPVFSLVMWIKNKFRFNTVYPLAFLISVSIFGIMMI